MPTLKVLKDFPNRSIVYAAGSTIEFSEDEAERLLAAKPGVFERVGPAKKSAPADKAARPIEDKAEE